MGSSVIKRLAAVVIGVLLLVYIGCQIYNSAYSQIKTESAASMTAENTMEATGYIIRNETLITDNHAGVLTYLLSDGEKISTGGTIAEIYANASDAAAQNEAKSLQSEAERLTLLNRPSSSFGTSPDSLDKQIAQNIVSMLNNVHTENYLSLSNNRDNLLYSLNERQIITGKTESFSDRISTLQSKISSLKASHGGSIGTITVPTSGYFVSETDGYENVFSVDNVGKLTPADLKALPKSEKVSSGVIGKVVSGLNWYIACVLSADQALTLTVDMDNVYVNLPFASVQKLPAKVIAVNQANKQSEAAVILQCDYMNSDLSHIRKEPIQISTESISGIRVRQKAIHMQKVTREVTDKDGNTTTEEKEVQGVFVMHGSELVFKEIVPLYTSGGYVICDDNQKSEKLFSKGTIQLYDEIVVEGTDLYNGKIVS